MPTAAPLSSEDLDRLTLMVQSAVAGMVVRSPKILTLEEAIVYTKNSSRAAFYRWTTRYNVHAASPGRFPRLELDRGIQREERSHRPHRRAA